MEKLPEWIELKRDWDKKVQEDHLLSVPLVRYDSKRSYEVNGRMLYISIEQVTNQTVVNPPRFPVVWWLVMIQNYMVVKEEGIIRRASRPTLTKRLKKDLFECESFFHGSLLGAYASLRKAIGHEVEINI